MNDDDERVRKTALRAIGGLGAPPLDSIADMARTDASAELHSSASTSLVEFKGENAIPQLNEALRIPILRSVNTRKNCLRRLMLSKISHKDIPYHSSERILARVIVRIQRLFSTSLHLKR